MTMRIWLLTAPLLSAAWLGQAARAQTAVTMSGDCTAAASGAVTCTKTNGVALGSAATQPGSAFDAAGAASAEATRAQPVEAAKMQYRGAWSASTAYAANDVVLQAGVLYIAPAAFTSAAGFNAANWTALTSVVVPSSTVGPTAASGNRTIAASDCGTVIESSDATGVTYSFPALNAGCSVKLIQGAAGQIQVVGSGVTIKPFTSGNSHTAGTYARVEVYYDSTSSAVFNGTTAP